MLEVCLIGLIAGGRSGVPRYAQALIGSLDRVAPEFGGLALRLLAPPAVHERIALGGGVSAEPLLERRFAPAQGPRRVLADQLAARRGRPRELLHFFDLTAPLLTRAPFVATVHDAAISHGFEGWRVAHKRILQPLALKRAVAVVAVSEFARQEAVSRLGGDPDRIEVIHSGPGLVSAGEDTGAPAGGSAPYLLCVANLLPHKNLPFLVSAFAALDGGVEPGPRLVLVGGWGGGAAEVRAAIDASSARARIELRTMTSDAELDSLYRGAQALLLPSLYEGFGFTALEAMARGCPVIAADIPALREVCRDGAWLIAPTDGPAWTAAIGRLLKDGALRDDLRRRGAAVASSYSWDQTAREVCRLFLRTGLR
jgi:glycosyltransferase involved in cell wall biosynthesis